MSTGFNKEGLEEFFNDTEKPLAKNFIKMIMDWLVLISPLDSFYEDDRLQLMESLLLDPAKGIATVGSLLELYTILLAVVTRKVAGPIERSEVPELDFTCGVFNNPKFSAMEIGKLNSDIAKLLAEESYERPPFELKGSKPEAVQKYEYEQDYPDLSNLKDFVAYQNAAKASRKIDIKIFRDSSTDAHIILKVEEKLLHQNINLRADAVVLLNVMTDDKRLENLFANKPYSNQVIIVDDIYLEWKKFVQAKIITQPEFDDDSIITIK